MGKEDHLKRSKSNKKGLGSGKGVFDQISDGIRIGNHPLYSRFIKGGEIKASKAKRVSNMAVIYLVLSYEY